VCAWRMSLNCCSHWPIVRAAVRVCVWLAGWGRGGGGGSSEGCGFLFLPLRWGKAF
jgi:hypothetical protein